MDYSVHKTLTFTLFKTDGTIAFLPKSPVAALQSFYADIRVGGESVAGYKVSPLLSQVTPIIIYRITYIIGYFRVEFDVGQKRKDYFVRIQPRRFVLLL